MVNQNVVFSLQAEDGGAASKSQGFITHVGLSEVTASFQTTTSPFSAIFAHEWLAPTDNENEWQVAARMAPSNPPSMRA